MVAYSGMATFKRDEKGKINGLYVEVGNLILDGKKAEEETPSPGKQQRRSYISNDKG